MRLKPKTILLCCALMCLATGVGVYGLFTIHQKKMIVVDAVKLFNMYELKKDLEEMGKVNLQAESMQLDSMNNALQLANSIKNEVEIAKLTYSCNYLKAKLERDYAQNNQDINEQVWKRLNPLLNEYGKENKLHLIIGANGMGSVLYNDDYYDRTDDVIKYVNKKYEGKN